MYLTQCPVCSSKGFCKNVTSQCCPNRAPQCVRTKYLLRKKKYQEGKRQLWWHSIIQPWNRNGKACCGYNIFFYCYLKGVSRKESWNENRVIMSIRSHERPFSMDKHNSFLTKSLMADDFTDWRWRLYWLRVRGAQYGYARGMQTMKGSCRSNIQKISYRVFFLASNRDKA